MFSGSVVEPVHAAAKACAARNAIKQTNFVKRFIFILFFLKFQYVHVVQKQDLNQDIFHTLYQQPFPSFLLAIFAISANSISKPQLHRLKCKKNETFSSIFVT